MCSFHFLSLIYAEAFEGLSERFNRFGTNQAQEKKEDFRDRRKPLNLLWRRGDSNPRHADYDCDSDDFCQVIDSLNIDQKDYEI